MCEFSDLKNKINHLGRAEYQYDRLASEFSEHYLELQRSGYSPLPNIEVLHVWLRHLNFEIRPALLDCWRKVAHLSGFSLGDLIEIDGTRIYAIKADAYPDLDYVRFTGFVPKKDGSPGLSTASANIKVSTKVLYLEKKLPTSSYDTLFFEGSSRLSDVNQFLKDQLAELS